MARAHGTPVLPTPKQAEQARRLLTAMLAEAKPKSKARFALHDRATDNELELPDIVVELLLTLLRTLAAGKGMSIIPMDAELTTQEAADFLSVSRPFVVDLLEAGQIKYRKVGTHRRIRFEDLLAYKEASIKDRSKALEELTSIAQKQKLGY